MTVDPKEHSEELFELFDRLFEGRLSEKEGLSLDRRLADDPAARRSYLEYADLHASLHSENVSVDAEMNRELVGMSDPIDVSGAKVVWLRSMLAAAACLALLAAGFIWGGKKSAQGAEDVVVATLIETKACAWGGGSLPTEKGARLTKGRMNLVEGLATLRFASGAEVVLEAPAELELIDPMRCVLHDGVLTAQVPPEAQGFVVDTASAHLVDHGTEFGVFVNRDEGTTDVQVFDGIVDVEQRTTNETQRMLAGQRSIVGDERFDLREGGGFEPGIGLRRSGVEGFEEGAIVISAGDGLGRDAYVQSSEREDHVSDTLLLVKNAKNESGYVRKAYVAFDLAPLRGRGVRKARVQLQLQRSGWGYASSLPDATFAVYGIGDEGLDDWSAESLSWENAPANLAGGAAIDDVKATLLGRFVIPQGLYTGFAGIEGKALVDFLEADTNGVTSFVVVRETLETRGGSLVHAFAGSSHPGGVAPSLLVIPE